MDPTAWSQGLSSGAGVMTNKSNAQSNKLRAQTEAQQGAYMYGAPGSLNNPPQDTTINFMQPAGQGSPVPPNQDPNQLGMNQNQALLQRLLGMGQNPLAGQGQALMGMGQPGAMPQGGMPPPRVG